MRFWMLIALGILLALFIALAVVTAADRLDVFDREGSRQAYMVQQADRLDLFDRHSKRLGYGIQRPDLPAPGEEPACAWPHADRRQAGGSWDLFRPDGSRLGVIQPGLGGLPSRLVLPPRKR